MKIYIDADACPVTRIAVDIALIYGIEAVLVCDTSHELNIPEATVITVSKGADNADFAIANLVTEGEIAITQDYGLASMCLAKRAYVINQNGIEYTEDNIVFLMESRHEAKKQRLRGKHLKGPKPRSEKQDMAFIHGFTQLLERVLYKGQ